VNARINDGGMPRLNLMNTGQIGNANGLAGPSKVVRMDEIF